jgi:hypothetical protein
MDQGLGKWTPTLLRLEVAVQRTTRNLRDARLVDRPGGVLCGPSVDDEVSDVSAHLRRERSKTSLSLLSQLRALPQFWPRSFMGVAGSLPGALSTWSPALWLGGSSGCSR